MSAERHKTILLVEDEELLASVEKEILENLGYTVIIANSGEKAVEIVGETSAIDLVLMDINLGAGIDGTEAAVLILRDRDIPVVFLSSHTEREIVEKTEKITSYGYVVKGSGPTVLQASIKMAFKLFEAKTKEMEKEAKMEAALAALVQQHDALSKLNKFSVELTMLSAEDDLESLITKRSKEIVGAELAVFSEYDHENRTTTIRKIEMEPGLLEKVVGLLGKQMEKIHSAVSDEMYREMTKEIIGTRKTLYEMSLGAISRPVGAAIQALLNVDRFIGIAYLIDGKLYGTSMLAMNKGQLDPPQSIVESFSYLASVSLRRKQAVRQREAALASLHESELKYRMLVENINDVLYTLDAEGRFTYVSPVIERLSGRKPDEILGRSFVEFVHPDDLPLLMEKFKQTMDGARESFEFRVLNGEEIRHVRTSSQRFLRDDIVMGLTGIMFDISTSKRTEQLLQASEKRYRMLVENTDTGLVVIDDKGIVISANEPYLRLVGAKRLEDVIGHSVMEWTAADEQENNARAVAICVGQGFIQDFETVYQHADGARIDIIINATVEDARKGGKHIASLCRDISERRQSEKLEGTLLTISQAIYSTDNLEDLFKHVHHALANIIPTANLFIALISDDGKQLTFPYSVDEKDIEATYVIDLDNTQSLTVEVFKTKKPLLLDETELQDRYASGRNKVWGTAPKCWLGVPLMIRETVIGVLAVQDYHKGGAYTRKDVLLLESAAGQIAIAIERKRAAEEIKRQLAEKDILLREVHHRIKNNIAAIGGLISLHLKSVTNPEAVAVLQDAIGRVDSMGILYDKLLRSEGFKDISVKNYLESLADTVIALFPISAKVKLEKHIDDFLLDPKRLFPLGIIINELITNKMKYAFNQKKTGLIKISLVTVEKHITLTILDNGARLPEGFAIDSAKGFGLTLVKMLTKQLGGSFSMEKKAGTRCTVEFDI